MKLDLERVGAALVTRVALRRTMGHANDESLRYYLHPSPDDANETRFVDAAFRGSVLTEWDEDLMEWSRALLDAVFDV